MKLPLKWAQSYARFTCTPKEFADKMTMTGSKVETYESEADRMKNVVIGKVAKLERHPDSDHLWVCQVDVGAGEAIQICTGAQNLKENDIIPVAMHGSLLPCGKEIKRGKLRGLESNGMLCSLDELDFATNDFPTMVEDGIMVLEGDDFTETPTLGADAAPVLGMDDYSFEFEITPNRPDCLSVRGLAREAAATFGVPFVDNALPALQKGGKVDELLRVKIDADDTCYRYIGAVVENARIGPSPRWLRERLRLSGVRPINNIVDITNYVMLEYGQPMHAFDYAYVNGGAITVRGAAVGEQIMTLDGVERPLSPEMMVIADEKGPIAVAGVMGGEFSGVYGTTEKIVFESASFNGPSVRTTAKKLGLRTESSSRFEKGLDPASTEEALARALQLVVELDAGDVVEGVVDAYPAPRAKRTMKLCPDEVNALLGTAFTEQEMVDILLPLGFEYTGGELEIPSWRGDVALSCDIAEEVARFAGYNNIGSTVLTGGAEALRTERQMFERTLRAAMNGFGFWECETYSFYSPKNFDLIALPADDARRNAVKIMNPFGEDTSLMRTTALPSILEVIGRNWAAREETAAVFEAATEYAPPAAGYGGDAPTDENLPVETQKLVLAAYGGSWNYLAAKGVVEALCAAFGTAAPTARRAENGPSYHPGRAADLYLGEDKLATVGEIHPAVCENYGIKTRVVAAEIRIDALFGARGATPQYQPLPKFPAVTRDLALVAKADVPAADIAAVIEKAGGKRLESVRLFDVYTGEKIGEGMRSLAYGLVLRDAAATLTDEDADAVVKKILKNLEPLGVTLRGA